MVAGKTVLLALFSLVVAAATGSPSSSPTILRPGDGYMAEAVPPETPGDWWVLYRNESSHGLVQSAVTVDAVHNSCLDKTPAGRSGRSVRVPDVAEPVLLLRGIADLREGPIRSISVPGNPFGWGRTLSVAWDGRNVEFRHVTMGDGFRVELADGERVRTLYSTESQDEGSWSLVWAGDLNGDGHLDVIMNATHKYSVQAVRLYVSRVSDGAVAIEEVASFVTTAC